MRKHKLIIMAVVLCGFDITKGTKPETQLQVFDKMVEYVSSLLVEEGFCALHLIGFDDKHGRRQFAMESVRLPLVPMQMLKSPDLQPFTCLTIFVSYSALKDNQTNLRDIHNPASVLWNQNVVGMHKGKVVIVSDERGPSAQEVSALDIPAPTYLVRPVEGSRILVSVICHGILTNSPSLKCPNPLTGLHLHVSAFGIPPYLLLDSQGIKVGGMEADVMEIVAQKLDFSISYRLEQFWFAFNNQTGQLEGTTVSVSRGLSTFGIGNNPMVTEFLSFIDFTSTLYYMEPRLMTRKPVPLSPFFNLLNPFSALIWMCHLLTLPLLFFAFCLVTRTGSSKATLSLGSTAAVVYGIFVSQGNKITTMSLTMPLRTLLAVWLMYCFFMKESFECNLRGYLVKTDYTANIDSHEDLYNAGQKLYLPAGNPFIDTYRTSPNPVERELVKNIGEDSDQLFFYDNKGNLPIELEHEIIENGGAVIISEKMIEAFYPIQARRHGRVPFRISPEGLYGLRVGFVIPRSGKHWKDDVNLILNHLHSGGIIHQLVEKYLEDKYRAKDSNIGTQALSSLGMEHFFVGFTSLVVGIFVLALAAFTWEVASNSCSNMTKANN